MIRQKVDYGKYRYSQKEILKYIGESAALCGAVDYLFYQTPWVMLFVVPVSVFFLKWKKKQIIRERKRRLNYQFRDALNSMSVAVQAGYSVENAVSACVRDLEQLYPKNEDIVAEFRYIETQQRVSVPVEELFLDLGQRCKVEDIENFASVLYTAKRSGGDLGNVISGATYSSQAVWAAYQNAYAKAIGKKEEKNSRPKATKSPILNLAFREIP